MLFGICSEKGRAQSSILKTKYMYSVQALMNNMAVSNQVHICHIWHGLGLLLYFCIMSDVLHDIGFCNDQMGANVLRV